MKIRESGIILFMENYQEGVEFYMHKLGLPLRVQKEDLAILDFGKSYLMIEDRGVASNSEKTRAQNPIVIRIDVYDFNETVNELRERGTEVTVRELSWGTIGVIIDPEGNRIEIKAAD
ncbi:VOC family protein [Paenibacillus sp. UNC451MF]|uniref:VOC family protein n=1 Tax=Paenibacillus sp. UNC451MF TaxID=1449063 RepID=UPI00048ED6A2|nr:VOC family protein [Paenibacillus sp. UNC451MF]